MGSRGACAYWGKVSAIAVAAIVFASGCNNHGSHADGNSNPASTESGAVSIAAFGSAAGQTIALAPSEAQLKILLHDKPIAGKEIEKVMIDIRKVSVIDGSGSEHILSQDIQQFDLLQLVNNISRLIGLKILLPGVYSQIRLQLGENNYVEIGGKQEPLRIPSGQTSGLKIVREFELKGGFITQIGVDFDAEKSISWSKGQGFILQPVIKVDQVFSLSADMDAPRVTLGLTHGLATNSDLVNLPVAIDDAGPVNSVGYINGAIFFSRNSIAGKAVFDANDLGLQELTFVESVSLIEGVNTVEVRSTDYFQNQGSASIMVVRDTRNPVVSTTAQSGTLTKNPNFEFIVNSEDATDVVAKVLQNGQLIATSNNKVFSVNALLVEGENAFNVQVTDAAGNTTNVEIDDVKLDSVPPALLVSLSDHQTFTDPKLSFSIVATDASPTDTVVVKNGVQILQSVDSLVDVITFLQEGLNVFEVSSVDAAGNVSAPIVFTDIVLDTHGPEIIDLAPANGAILTGLTFPVSGQVNEPLSVATVNSQMLTLSPDRKSFSGMFTAQSEGSIELKVDVKDLVGNSSSRIQTVQIMSKVLNGDLLSVVPESAGRQLAIIGASGAVRAHIDGIPDPEVSAYASIFNRTSTKPNADGSFLMRLSPFNEATVSVHDPWMGRTESAVVRWGSGNNTLLSGTVKDVEGNPISGATVSIIGTQLSTTTSGSGIFSFSNPVTGDQTLLIDGTAANQPEPPAVFRKYSKTHVNVSIGLSQSNVLQTPIYLSYIPMDGTSTTLAVSEGATVTHPSAPGVELDIPPDSAVFPSGNDVGSVSMRQISKDVATIPPVSDAVPNTVVALEPSGMKFTKPVEVRLPNDNDLPPGVEMVILSMNSEKGLWEIDGTATVSSDGQSVVTKPGEGITHFSLIYAAPIGPVIREMGQKDRPGADPFSGAFSMQVQLPGYKSLGQNRGPTLLYKSSWAKPSVVVSNLFDIPRQEVHVTQTESGSEVQRIPGALQREVCVPERFLGLITYGRECHTEYEDYDLTLYYNNIVDVTSWYEPDFIYAQFYAPHITSERLMFRNTPERPIPNQSVISYSLDLKDTQTQSYLKTGVYPYRSEYEVHLKNMIIGSAKQYTWHQFMGTPEWALVQDKTIAEQNAIEEAFPTHVNGYFYVQNKTDSAAGRGWKIGGVQKIVNPAENRIMIEESDGEIATYTINNTISTLFHKKVLAAHDEMPSPTNLSLGGGFAWPKAYVAAEAGWSKYSLERTEVFEIDLANEASGGALIGQINRLGGSVIHCTIDDKSKCHFHTIPAELKKFSVGPESVVSLHDGRILSTDFRAGIVQFLNQGMSWVGGKVDQVPYFLSGSSEAEVNSYCISQLGILSGCPAESGTFAISKNPSGPQSGILPYPGFLPLPVQDAVDGSLAEARFNKPMGMAPGPGNTIVVADTGNNVVRRIDLILNTVDTIAGNGMNVDFGDGNRATEAGIYHPRGVAYDSLGNLYISTENGFIRKVDTTGVISTFAGSLTGERVDIVAANKALFKNPYGLVVDDLYGLLYVADRDHHRVVRIDFATNTAVTVAGNLQCSGNETSQDYEMGDGSPALDASICYPTQIGLDDQHNLLVFDVGHQRIRRVNFQNNAGGVLAFSSNSRDHSSLLRNEDGTWTRSFRNGNTVLFDEKGLQSVFRDRIGREERYSYDSHERLISVVDPVGSETKYNYSGARLSSIQDPASRITGFAYNGLGDLIRITYPDGSVEGFGYDPDGLMIAQTNARGMTYQYKYNQWNRLEKKIDPKGNEIVLSDSTSVVMANGHGEGSPAELRSQGVGESEVAEVLVDGNGNATSFVRDPRGYAREIQTADGNITKIMRDSRGRPVVIRRPNGTEVTLTYNSESTDPRQVDDIVAQSDSASGITTSQVFDGFGNVLSRTNARGFVANYEYASNGLLMRELGPKGAVAGFTYNSLGLVTTRSDGLGNVVAFNYDNLGNLRSVTDQSGGVTQYVRDVAGNVLSITDSAGLVTQYEYDSVNRLTAVTTPKLERTEYEYLATGALSKIKDAMGSVSQFEYDQLGRLIKHTDPLGLVSMRSYDKNGNLVGEVDPNGNQKTYRYDNLNRVFEKALPDNLVSVTYNDEGQMTEIKDRKSRIELAFDPSGRVVRLITRGLGELENLPVIQLDMAYDKNSNRTTLSGPSGMTSYRYDEQDLLVEINNPHGEQYRFEYGKSGWLNRIARPGGSTQYNYAPTGLVNSITHFARGEVFNAHTLDRNLVGNVTGISTLFGSRSLAYDGNQQLVAGTNSEAPELARPEMTSEAFSYDSIFNRKTDQLGGYTYDGRAQRLVEDYNFRYVYDNNGNLVSKQEKSGFPNSRVWNFSYSSENQLIGFRVYGPGGSEPVKEVYYSYDVLGRRVQKRVVDREASDDPTRSSVRRYGYDGQEILAEYDGNNNLLVDYTHSMLRTDDVLSVHVTQAGVDTELATAVGSYQYLKDHQGSITEVTDSSGGRIQRYVYSAFGVLLGVRDAETGKLTQNPPLRTSYSYTGRELDSETGFYYYRARYYDPGTGRFLQRDPHPGKLSVPVSVVNGYSYVGNNPANRADPSGMSWLGDLFSTAAAIVLAPILMMAALPVAIFDPALGLSMFMIGLQFSPIGLAANLIGTGKLPTLSFFEGTPFVRNSVLPEIVGRPGFSYGAAAFIAPTDGMSAAEEQTLLRHEYGHTLQYREMGGWSYMSAGSSNAGSGGWFEQDADRRATNYFGTPVCDYPGSMHPVPACRY